MPRLAHHPDEKTKAEVAALVSFGIPHDEVAKYIGVTVKTLKKHYGAELEVSHIKANAAVGKFLYTAASGKAIKEGATHADCIRAAMFWAKTRMGWRETNSLDVTSNGESITRIERVIIDRPTDQDA